MIRLPICENRRSQQGIFQGKILAGSAANQHDGGFLTLKNVDGRTEIQK